MRLSFLFAAILISYSSWAQRKIVSTDTLKFTGAIKNEKAITVSDLLAFQSQHIDDLVITNQRGETKDTIRHLKGIPLKTVLENIEILSDRPKYLNEFYFIFMGADGYKVVFSWNEIFNTDVGNNLYLVTEMNGKKINQMEERILFLSSKDFKTGRRLITGLDKIIVKRVD